MFVYTPFAHPRSYRGFTFIELMVTIAIVAILAALAAPSLQAFIVRNTFTNIGNEFSGSILRARNEAVSKNICTTMCMSNTIDNATPICLTNGNDWQVGWMVFMNPKCDINYGTDTTTNAVSADDMILVRRAGKPEYILAAQGGTPPRKINFNARGNTSLSNAGEFDLLYLSVNNPLTTDHAFNICLDKMGRTRSISTSSSCS